MADDKVKEKVDTHLGKTFNKERKENNLYRKWVEEIVGDDDSYQNLTANLTHYTKITPFKKFKQICANDDERNKFVEGIRAK